LEAQLPAHSRQSPNAQVLPNEPRPGWDRSALRAANRLDRSAPPSALIGTPSALIATPGALIATPSALIATPGALTGTLGALTAAPGALIGTPGALTGKGLLGPRPGQYCAAGAIGTNIQRVMKTNEVGRRIEDAPTRLQQPVQPHRLKAA
jgi:hypothetical protein